MEKKDNFTFITKKKIMTLCYTSKIKFLWKLLVIYKNLFMPGVCKFFNYLGSTSKFFVQFPLWGPEVLDWPANLTSMWCFLVGACKQLHIFVCTIKKKNHNNYGEIIGCPLQNWINQVIRCLGFVHPWFIPS